MNKLLIGSAVGGLLCSAACSPVPVKLVGEVDVQVITQKIEAAPSSEKSVTDVTFERVVRKVDICPKLGASLVNTEVSGRSKICYYVAEKEA